ncbi:MAG: UbiA family prenyltransferase [Candidatus Omnitrophica bacterium]|nr:UbiA family prenyltransferase [Candidatus Omnitrophota bacterium]
MLEKVKIFLELVKFEHTVFALPFAYLGMVAAGRGWPGFWVFFWVTAAMAGARTAGMCLNRLIDLKIDAKNPRTKNRSLITGEFPLWGARTAAGAALLVFFLSAWMLNPLCLKLSPIALLLLTGYHTVKRFSFLSHFVAGFVLSAAPMGGWIAATGRFSWTAALLSLAVLFWVAGFDILYSLQDLEFDRAYGLHSIPVRFGRKRALWVSRYCHAATLGFLVLFGIFAGFGILYWTGVIVCSVLLFIEHRLLADGELDHLNAAFFVLNGWVGILLFVFTVLEIFC